MAKQQSSPNNRRGDMIYCERCGEDYSATYRRCPFCDERPGRRIDDHGYAARSPLQLAVLIGSLVLTTVLLEVPFLAAAFGFVPVGLSEYGVALALGFLVIPIVEIVKFIQRKPGK